MNNIHIERKKDDNIVKIHSLKKSRLKLLEACLYEEIAGMNGDVDMSMEISFVEEENEEDYTI